MSDTVQVERSESVCHITLNRPRSRNALNTSMVSSLAAAVDQLRTDLDTRLVVLRGTGKDFCAGLDLKAVQSEPREGFAALPSIILGLREIPQPVVAVLQGAAAGGGFALALAADIRIATPDARMNAAFVRLGLSGCELGLSYFLPRLIGTSIAAELMMTGRFLHADRAESLGLVSQVVEAHSLQQAEAAIVADLLRASRAGLWKTKETMARTAGVADLSEVMAIEATGQRECMQVTDFDAAARAFIEKTPRQPEALS